jgi:hypothetical protein
VTGAPPIDVDEPDTWPAATRTWATARADSVRGSTEHTADLALELDDEPAFRATFGDRPLLAYHCTRLRAREVDYVREHGLRLLSSELVRDRIEAAHAAAELSDDAYRFATTRNVYAIRNTTGREGQICFVLGRTTFDDDPWGCDPLLAYWGGEAMRGGPDDAPLLKTIGRPAIVVAQLRVSPSTITFPSLQKVFVGRLLGTERPAADVFYKEAVPANDVVDVWQPGDPEYERHQALPR